MMGRLGWAARCSCPSAGSWVHLLPPSSPSLPLPILPPPSLPPSLHPFLPLYHPPPLSSSFFFFTSFFLSFLLPPSFLPTLPALLFLFLISLSFFPSSSSPSLPSFLSPPFLLSLPPAFSPSLPFLIPDLSTYPPTYTPIYLSTYSPTHPLPSYSISLSPVFLSLFVETSALVVQPGLEHPGSSHPPASAS